MRYRTRALAIAGAAVIASVPITIGAARFFRHPSSVLSSSFDSRV